MPMKRVSKEALIGQTIIFDHQTDDETDKIIHSHAMNHIDIISLDGLNGSPVIPTVGTFSIYVKTDEDGGFKSVPDNGLLSATKTGGSLLADGVAVGSNFVGFPLAIKIVPNGVDVAVAYRVSIKQSSVQLNKTPDNFINSFDVSNRDVPGLGVYLQDQTAETLDVPFLRQLNPNSTIAVETVIDSRTVTVSAGHGALVGNTLEIANGGLTFMQTEILAVVGDVLTIDQPVNHVYPAGSFAIISTDDMLVDGSITPVIYSILPLPLQAGHIIRILLDIRGTGDMDFSTFGSDAGLVNGCVLRIRRADGDFKNLFNWKDNGDFLNKSFDNTFLLPKQGGTIKSFIARNTYGGQDKRGVVIVLDGSLGEELQVIIQDDLTAGDNVEFRMIAQGHEI